MACCCPRSALRHDEVSPVSITLKNMSTEPAPVVANGNMASKPEAEVTSESKPVSGKTKEDPKPEQPQCEIEAPAEPQFQMPDVEMVTAYDGEGSPISLGRLFGVWIAPMAFLSQQILKSQLYTFHDSDVILGGYAKSGTHWMWEMLQMMLKGRAEHSTTPKERLMLTFSSQEFFDTLQPPRVFNCHAPFVGYPPSVREGRNRCKIVYLLRNPRDLAVSYYHHLKSQTDFNYEGTFHGFLSLFLEGKVPGGSWFDYVLGWENTLKNNPQLSVLVLHYEDIKEDPVSALQKVDAFLGLGREDALVREVAEQCHFRRMKVKDAQISGGFSSVVNKSKTGENFIFRKGEVGDWKNWFSVADNERFQRVLDDKMKNSALSFRYEL